MSDIANDDRPMFRLLDREECESLLERNHVGRIAFAYHDRVDIQPIHYVFAKGVLVGRTSAGAKLVTLEHNRWIAFETDEVRGLFDWQSVVVQGTFERLDPEGTAGQRLMAEEAVTRLRALLPETRTEADPVAFRTVLFQVVIREMTGRAAESG